MGMRIASVRGLSALALALALAFASAPLCLGRLMAIDLGGEFLKVAVVAPGRTPISIAINEMSRRKTPGLVGFVDGQRILGEQAVTMSTRHPDKTFGRLRDLIGRRADDPFVKQVLDLSMLKYEVVPDERRSSIRIKVPGVERTVAIEELMASEFAYAKKIAEAHAGASISECVILVPSHFGPHQRQAVIDAVELSGLTLLSLMNTHAAAALQYGIERDFKGRTEDVILYDVASTDVVAALVRYSSFPTAGNKQHLSQFQVLDVAWRQSTGASFLDGLMMKHFANQFVAQHGTEDILQHPKVVAKMAKPVRRVKEMLSVNADAPLIVEELFQGMDFHSKITREELEQIAGSYWDEVKQPLVELLERNKIDSAANISVQLLGGGSRMPRVRSELASTLADLKLEKNLDADEAPALGGGLMAANMSTMFRLRAFGMQDGLTYPVTATLEPGEGIPDDHKELFKENGGKELAPYMRKLMSKRKVSLAGITADSFKMSLSFSGDRKPCCYGTDTFVTYTVSGISDVIKKYNEPGRVWLSFGIDGNGVVALNHAESVVEVEETIQVEKLVPEEEPATDSSSKDGNETGKEGNSTAPAKAPKMKKIKVPQQVMKPRVMALKLEAEYFGVLPMNAAELTESKAILEEYAALERAKQFLEMAKNSLESYIINSRSALRDSDVQQVTTEEQREVFLAALTEMEDWMYEDEADSATGETFMHKKAELEAFGDPIQRRLDEFRRRPERVKAAIELTDLIAMATNSWPEVKPWLNATHVEALKHAAADLRKWVDEVTLQQEQKPLHEEPVFLVEDLQKRFELVSQVFAKLNSIRAPKPPPPPPAVEGNSTVTPESKTSNSTSSSGDDTSPDKHDELR